MRKQQKKEILEVVKNFPEIHKEIWTAAKKGDTEITLQLLYDCQEYAINLSEVIKGMEKKEIKTNFLFRKYCDVLMDIIQRIEKNGKCTDKTLFVKLNKKIMVITQSIEKDIPVRKEVVFFPYKASMWDSLESIYLAAKEDEEFDAYCVPIPYFDKNPDGSFKTMYYEGAEYPSNIEVIDWESYNFEERRPDIIYIHNPYDEWNHVSSVHPRFYAENLKKYTDELIYVPYFVLGEIKPDEQDKIDNIKDFCFLPGTIYADKVILQSQDICKIYINEFMKAAKENNIPTDRKMLEKKFLGLGSPKFDKVMNTKKENLEIPEEWLKIIEKSDGSWKKIIFYNTSLNALLKYNEKMLEKIKDVFRIFKEHHDEVILLWRPHPLMNSTIKSMRPQLWSEYDEIVNQYKIEGWGIYDDTADIDRAVVLSDAYYGDQSSVVQLYQKKGKPIMIQNVNILRENVKE